MFDTFIHRYLRVPYRVASHSYGKKDARHSVLLLHGLGASDEMWQPLIELMKDSQTRIITVDLLGFGKSPRPKNITYDATVQARAIRHTIKRYRLKSPMLVVGHSLGSLVAIELATHYPRLTDHLILCSPPLYDSSESSKSLLPSFDNAITKFYKAISENPERALPLLKWFSKLNIINPTFEVDENNIEAYTSTLRSAIVNQTALDDARKLTIPIDIIAGTLDPIVINSNARKLAHSNKNCTMHELITGHEPSGKTLKRIVDITKKWLKQHGEA